MRGEVFLVCVLGLGGCCSVLPDDERLEQLPPVQQAPWDAARAELLSWRASSPDFDQNRALEGSGLAASDRYLYVVAEKYSTLIQLDPADGFSARVLRLGVPPGAELEGVAWNGGEILICDEAHAAVYAAELDERAMASGTLEGPLPVRQLPLLDLEIRGGKVGFEGIAVSPDGSTIYLLLERSGSSGCGCVATVYPLHRSAEGLSSAAPPMRLPLEDCNWRLADLVMVDGRLLAMQSQYPGERYRVVAIDPAARKVEVLFDLTELGRSLRPRGFGNNLEGMAVAADGWLYMVGDNADVQRALHGSPPPTDEVTAFLRLPPAAGP